REPAPAPVAFDSSVFKELAEAIRTQAASQQVVPERAESPPDEDGEPTVISESIVGGGPGSEQKITVINKIPRTMLNVMEQQFKLMHGWMEPLTQLTHSQNSDLQELKELVEGCMRDYEQLMRGLGKARGRSDS
ncbi:MAG: hypothetical protein HON53_17200, partial [Planctomycetaceae bacterium]|nr:hypothetical protein [Planctomycetaceae bacterium]